MLVEYDVLYPVSNAASFGVICVCRQTLFASFFLIFSLAQTYVCLVSARSDRPVLCGR